ncbi:MAG: hypothetical protein JXR07_17500 [Reichenbachiella sp.]
MKTFSYNILNYIFTLVIFISSCDEAEMIDKTAVNAVSDIVARDLFNNGDPSDIELSFSKIENEDLILEYRVFLSLSTFEEVLDVENASSLTSDFYQSISPSNSDIQVNLDPNLKTITGEELVPEAYYTIYILSVAKDLSLYTNKISAPARPFRVSQKSDIARTIFLVDVGNTENSNDFQVRFNAALDESKVAQYRAFIIKSDKASAYTIEEANELTNNQYQEIPVNGDIQIVGFKENLLDTDGDNIVNGRLYRIMILSIADGVISLTNDLSYFSNEVLLENKSYVKTISGEFQGAGGISYHPDGYLITGNTNGNFRNEEGNGVYKITLDGTATHYSEELINCTGNIFHPLDNIIYQLSKNGVYGIDENGNNTLYAQPNGVIDDLSVFSSPTEITIYQDSLLFVANCDRAEIYYLKENSATNVAVIPLTYTNPQDAVRCPKNIVTTNYDEFIILNNRDNRLFRMPIQYEIVRADPNDKTPPPVPSPSEFISLTNGEIFHSIYYIEARSSIVATTSFNRVLEIFNGSNMKILAGNGTPRVLDGDLQNSSFIEPINITSNGDGSELYILDQVDPVLGMVVVRKIELVD